MILHEVEEAAYASACAGVQAPAWGSVCGAAVRGFRSPSLPPPSLLGCLGQAARTGSEGCLMLCSI